MVQKNIDKDSESEGGRGDIENATKISYYVDIATKIYVILQLLH